MVGVRLLLGEDGPPGVRLQPSALHRELVDGGGALEIGERDVEVRERRVERDAEQPAFAVGGGLVGDVEHRCAEPRSVQDAHGSRAFGDPQGVAGTRRPGGRRRGLRHLGQGGGRPRSGGGFVGRCRRQSERSDETERCDDRRASGANVHRGLLEAAHGGSHPAARTGFGGVCGPAGNQGGGKVCHRLRVRIGGRKPLGPDQRHGIFGPRSVPVRPQAGSRPTSTPNRPVAPDRWFSPWRWERSTHHQFPYLSSSLGCSA